MPLFECTKCHTIDNTALTNWAWRTIREKLPALCSECDPEIAEWHGRFPKVLAVEFRKLHPTERLV